MECATHSKHFNRNFVRDSLINRIYAGISITTMLLQAIEHAVDRCLAASAAVITSDEIKLEPRIFSLKIGLKDTLDYSDRVFIVYTPPEKCSLVLFGDNTTKVFECNDTQENISKFKKTSGDLFNPSSYAQKGYVSYGMKSLRITKTVKSPYSATGETLFRWRTIKTPLSFSKKFTLRQTDPSSTPPTA
jgi:hypothetical protein